MKEKGIGLILTMWWESLWKQHLCSAQEERLANSFRLAITRGKMSPLLSQDCQLSQWVFNKKIESLIQFSIYHGRFVF